MAVIQANENEVRLLARLMRAEAEEDGDLGMLMVGNVCVNRVRARCLDFINVNSLERVIFQSPGGFEAVQYPYFYQRARERDIRLARRVINGERFWPAEFALWFYKPPGSCPARWYGWNTGRYKSHCFYAPTASECPSVYTVY